MQNQGLGGFPITPAQAMKPAAFNLPGLSGLPYQGMEVRKRDGVVLYVGPPIWRWNPSESSSATVSPDRASFTGTSSGSATWISGTPGASTKWYAEAKLTAVPQGLGVCLDGEVIGNSHGRAGYDPGGAITGESGGNSTGATWGTSDVIGIAVDPSNLGGQARVWFSKNGVWQNGSPSLGTGGALLANVGRSWVPQAWTANNGAGNLSTALKYVLPDGFRVL